MFESYEESELGPIGRDPAMLAPKAVNDAELDVEHTCCETDAEYVRDDIVHADEIEELVIVGDRRISAVATYHHFPVFFFVGRSL